MTSSCFREDEKDFSFNRNFVRHNDIQRCQGKYQKSLDRFRFGFWNFIVDDLKKLKTFVRLILNPS